MMTTNEEDANILERRLDQIMQPRNIAGCTVVFDPAGTGTAVICQGNTILEIPAQALREFAGGLFKLELELFALGLTE